MHWDRSRLWVLCLLSVTTACGGSAAKGSEDTTGNGQTDASCTTQPLPFYAQDAAYSAPLDRIVCLSGFTIFLLDPTNAQSTEIPLPREARWLSVSPDGTSAAVAHLDGVSIVDLQQQRVITTVDTMTTEGGSVVMASNGFAYLFPQRDGEGDVDSIEIAAARDHRPADAFYNAQSAKLHPDGKTTYVLLAVVPGRLGRADISGGVTKGLGELDDPGDYFKGGNLWISPDGADIFTGCGTVFRASPTSATGDGSYRGALPTVCRDEAKPIFRSMALDPDDDRVYAIQDAPDDSDPTHNGLLATFSYQSLNAISTKPVPCVAKGSTTQSAEGELVLLSPDRSKLFVLAGPGPGGGHSALAVFDPQ